MKGIDGTVQHTWRGLSRMVLTWVVLTAAAASGVEVLEASGNGETAAWNQHISKAEMLERTGNYRAALAEIKQALRIAEKSGWRDSRYWLSWNNLGSEHQKLGDLATAEHCYQKARSAIEQSGRPEHPDMGIVLGNLATLALERGDFKAAEKLFVRSLTILEKAPVRKREDEAAMLGSLSAVAVHQKRYEPAEEYLRRSIAIFDQMLPPTDAQHAANRNQLALLYRAMGRKADALATGEEALAMMERAVDAKHPLLIRCLSNLAISYLEMDLYAQAETTFLRALRIGEERLGPEHPDVGAMLGNYSILLKRVKRKDEARQAEKRSQVILSGFAASKGQSQTVNIHDLNQ